MLVLLQQKAQLFELGARSESGMLSTLCSEMTYITFLSADEETGAAHASEVAKITCEACGLPSCFGFVGLEIQNIHGFYLSIE